MSAFHVHHSKVEDTRELSFLSRGIDRIRVSASVLDEFPFGTDNTRRNWRWWLVLHDGIGGWWQFLSAVLSDSQDRINHRMNTFPKIPTLM